MNTQAFVKRRRVRPPRDFGIFNGLEVDEADFARWKEFIVTYHGGKLKADSLLDVIHHNNKVGANLHASLFVPFKIEWQKTGSCSCCR